MAYRTFQVIVGTSPVLVMHYSKDRTAWHLLHNNTNATVYFGPDRSISATNGMGLPQGLEHTCSFHEGGDPREPVWAIADNKGRILCVREDLLPKEVLEEKGYGA